MEETKEKTVGGKSVVEKRLKPTLIRRRKTVEPPPPPPSEEKVAEAAAPQAKETPPAAPVVKDALRETPKEVVPQGAKVESASKQETEKGPSLGIVGHISDILPSVKDSWKERLKRAPKRKKSRAELDMEMIQRVGGLKQFAGIVVEEGEEPESDKPLEAAVVEERVFQPTPSARRKKAGKKQFKKTVITTPKAIKKVIRIEEKISVSNLSQSMGVKSSELIKRLMALEIMATANQLINIETASLLAEEYGFKIEHTAFKEEDLLVVPDAHATAENLAHRPPVVTVMGHVDHGKTSILDVIRQTRVVDQEAGGITQHIGAYDVTTPRGSITFLDTPGHEAFTSMRARGAKVTDIAVIVVAADDGVMPQTIEAINHAKAAEVPIIVAINKIDIASAQPDRVMKGLTDHGLVPEEWGGDVICVKTSARTKEGIDKLLEMILLQAEMLELKANPNCRPKGVIVEAKLDKNRGAVATVLVQEGRLEVGKFVVCGNFSGKIRSMFDASGHQEVTALPSKPVEIVGLSGVPAAGDVLVGVESDEQAKQISEQRQQKMRESSLREGVRFSLEDLQKKAMAGELHELNVILKADVQGSVEAVGDALVKLSTDQVKINLLHTGVGSINEGDILLAKASLAVVVGFNVMPDQKAEMTSEREGVSVRTYRIIYELLDEVKKAMEGLLAPELIERIIGRAEVREIFNVSKVGTIAGCAVVNGKITRNAKARLLRNQTIVFDGKIASLKRFKDDAKEVLESYECGIGFEKFNDIKTGDEIVAYIIEKRAAKL